MLQKIFHKKKPIIGMVHFLPLPGSLNYNGDMKNIILRAVEDAKSLKDGGVDGLLFENYGDLPFRKTAPQETVSAMEKVIKEVIKDVDLPFGVNVLRNDPISALKIASATGATFIRVNVHTFAMVTVQGIIEGNPYETLAYRQKLGKDIKIFADVCVKHAFPLGNVSVEDVAKDTAYVGLADAILLTGKHTGEAPSLEDCKRVKKVLQDFTVLIASGLNIQNIHKYLPCVDGAIVGTYFKKNGLTKNPVDKKRVKKFMESIKRYVE